MSLKDRMRKKKQALAKGDSGDDKSELKDHLKQRKAQAEAKKTNLKDRMKAKAEEIDDDDDEVDEEVDETLEADISAAQDRYLEVVKRVQLTEIIEETTELGNEIIELPEAIAAVRSRGYHFRSYLEGKIDIMAEKWDMVNDRIELWLEEESESLDDELAAAEKAYSRLKSKASRKYVDHLNAALDKLETQIDASESKIKALYDQVNREMATTARQLRQINTQLDWLDQADFDLNAGEGLYMAAEAEWDDNRDKPEGFIYVTDQRIIFEQNEKKGGMLGFGGKQVKEVLWEVMHDQVEAVVPSNEGLGGGKDMMTLKLGAGAPFAEIVAEIKGGIEADYWAQQLNRANKGLISEESTVEPDPELIARLREAPTECPNCGGVLSTLVAGDHEVTCEYCGSVIRV